VLCYSIAPETKGQGEKQLEIFNQMHVTVAKVDEIYFDGDADSLSVTGALGQMTILPEHMPLITTLRPCTLIVRAGDATKEFEIEGGVLEVRRDAATVIL